MLLLNSIVSLFLLISVAHNVCGFSCGFSSLSKCQQRRSPPTCLHLFRFVDQMESLLMDSLTVSDANTKVDDDPTKELGLFTDLEEGSLESARESLQRFLQLWAHQLEDDPKGLATPIVTNDWKKVTKDWKKLPNCTDYSMKLIFRPPKRYLSYKEQRSMEKGVLPDRKGAKVDAWSPGGVELIMLTSNETELQLQVRRCDIDGDTIIKYSSERAIVRRLKEAMRIWRKVRAMKVETTTTTTSDS